MSDDPGDDSDERYLKMALAFTSEVQEQIDRIFLEHPTAAEVIPFTDSDTGELKFFIVDECDIGL